MHVVLISVITICAAAAVIFMGSIHGGRRCCCAQLHGSVEEISKAAAQDPTVIKALKLESHDMAERVKLLTAVYDEALKLIPACIMILSCLTSYIAYLILSKSLSRRGEVNRMPRFREFAHAEHSRVRAGGHLHDRMAGDDDRIGRKQRVLY